MKSSVVSGENRGSVNVILLKALQSGDKYGYEINKEIEAKSGGKFFLKEASLYSGLKRLEASGFITSYWQDGELGIRRHYYSITEKGIEKLNNSNFTWDSSKNFLGEMFSDQNQQKQNKTIENSNENTTSPISLQNNNNNQINNVNNENINNSNENKSSEFVKKNPFQIEVNPLQQSFFDTAPVLNEKFENENKIINENNETKLQENLTQIENQNSIVEETKVNENLSPIEALIQNGDAKNDINEKVSQTEKVSENLLNEEKFSENKAQNLGEEKLENKSLEDNLIEKTDELSYEKMINSFEENNYSSSLQTGNVVDIASLLNLRNKEETKLFEETVNNENLNFEESLEKVSSQTTNNFRNNNNNDNNFNLNFNNNFNDNNNENKSEEQKSNLENFNETKSNEQKTNLDFKNIFGSLLIDSSKENSTNNSNMNSINNENPQTNLNGLNNLMSENGQNPVENGQSETKPELPRVDVDNNVNVMLNAKKSVYDHTANNSSNRSYENKIVQTPVSGNFSGVKQYIDNVHKQTLISRATNITEEVNLEGINIREYSKMNNKLLHNSNYVYILKLNFVLALVLSMIIVCESVISFIVLNNFGLLSAFEIIFFSSSILFALIYAYIESYKYFKDKFRVQLNSYSLKSQIFSFILIFIVAFVLLLCINIFAGMNINNSFDFVLKIILESLVLINLILYPVLKSLFFKLKTFSN